VAAARGSVGVGVVAAIRSLASPRSRWTWVKGDEIVELKWQCNSSIVVDGERRAGIIKKSQTNCEAGFVNYEFFPR
jgi:hypothetical protein